MKKFLAVVIAIAMVFPLMVTDANAAKTDVAKDENSKSMVADLHDIRETTFTNTYNLKNADGEVALKMKFEVDVNYYEYGSFRAFYNILDTRVYVDECIADVEIDFLDKQAYPRQDYPEYVEDPAFPVSQIGFSYSCVVKTKEPVDRDSKLGKELEKAGFKTYDDFGVAPFSRIIGVDGRFKVM